MSTTGVSIAKKIADGDLKFFLTTVQGDVKRPFEATTAVTPPDPTLQDAAPDYPTTTDGADGIPVRMATPAAWKWSDSQESEGLAAESKPSTVVERRDTIVDPVPARRKPWIAIVAGTAVLALLVFLGVRRFSHAGASPTAQGSEAPSIVAPAPSASAARVVPPPSVPAPPSAPAASAKLPVLPPTPTAPFAAQKPQEQLQSAPKKPHHHHSHPAPAANTVEWKDPSGNPIPSP